MLTQLAALLVEKVPLVEAGSNYGADYFLDRLWERYSDLTAEQLEAFVEADASQRFTCDGTWVSVRPGTALAATLMLGTGERWG